MIPREAIDVDRIFAQRPNALAATDVGMSWPAQAPS